MLRSDPRSVAPELLRSLTRVHDLRESGRGHECERVRTHLERPSSELPADSGFPSSVTCAGDSERALGQPGVEA